MSAPTIRYYVGFGSTWLTADADIVWTEVTGYDLRKGGSGGTRGRANELDDMRAGTYGFMLDNSDRRFDPTYAAGPYFGNLLPGVPVKITATANAVEYPVFRGFVNGWPQDYDRSNRQAYVSVSCTDGFRKLSSVGTGSHPFTDYVFRELDPVHWWPLSDPVGSDTVTDLGSSPSPGIVQGATLGQESLDGIDSSTAFAAVQYIGILDLPDLTSGAFLVKTSDAGGYLYVGRQATTGDKIVFGSDAVGGGLTIDYAGGTLIGTAGAVINDGATHLVVWSFGTGSSDDFLHIDGVDVLDSRVSGGTVTDSLSSPTIGPDMVGLIAHFITTSEVWTAAQATDMWNALNGWSPETSGARIDRYLDLAGWPSDLIDTATGNTLMGPATYGDNAALLIKGAEKAEQGRFFFSRDGKATFQDRYYNLTVTAGSTSQATFSDDGAGIAYSGVGYDFDDTFVFSKVRGSRVGGVSVTRSNPAGAPYGENTDTSLVGLQSLNDQEVIGAVEYRLARYKDPQRRWRPIELKLHSLSAAQQATVLGLELGHRVTVERTPQGVGSQIADEAVVEQIAHRVTPGEWVTTFHVSITDTADFFILDVSVLDGTDVLAY